MYRYSKRVFDIALAGASLLLLSGRWNELRVLFQPKGSAEEVKEELEDLFQRESRGD